MPLIVEDGTGKADAQSYLSVADADAYFSDRGVSAWSGVDAVKASALISATEYIDIRWGKFLKGILEFKDTQALLFPRINLYDDQGRHITGIPDRLERATAEYALIALTSVLMPNPEIQASGNILVESSETVGPISETKKYQQGFITARPYPKADSLMSVFIIGSGQGSVYI